MNESAQERRRRTAAAKAVEFARSQTISAGLGSFTVEDVCEAAEISRRTFFNYFASKEDAVLGIVQTPDDADLEEAFVSGTGDLLEDLVSLSIALWERHAVSEGDVAAISAAIEREPKLLTRLFSHVQTTEQSAIALVHRRGQFNSDDPRASTVAVLMGSLMRLAVDDSLHKEASVPFEDLFRARVDTARELFSSTHHARK